MAENNDEILPRMSRSRCEFLLSNYFRKMSRSICYTSTDNTDLQAYVNTSFFVKPQNCKINCNKKYSFPNAFAITISTFVMLEPLLWFYWEYHLLLTFIKVIV